MKCHIEIHLWHSRSRCVDLAQMPDELLGTYSVPAFALIGRRPNFVNLSVVAL